MARFHLVVGQLQGAGIESNRHVCPGIEIPLLRQPGPVWDWWPLMNFLNFAAVSCVSSELDGFMKPMQDSRPCAGAGGARALPVISVI